MSAGSDNPDLEALWATVFAEPDDSVPKLVLADYLEENGDPNTAFALRWCVGRNRWPRLTKTSACWYTDSTVDHPGKKSDVERALLPLVFMLIGRDCERLDELSEIPSGIKMPLRTAIEGLGVILSRLRAMTEAFDPGEEQQNHRVEQPLRQGLIISE